MSADGRRRRIIVFVRGVQVLTVENNSSCRRHIAGTTFLIVLWTFNGVLLLSCQFRHTFRCLKSQYVGSFQLVTAWRCHIGSL